MNFLLQKLLNKREIKREDLSDRPLISGGISEKGQFGKWEQILSDEPTSIAQVEEFCRDQLNKIEMQWQDFSNSSQKNERLVIAHTIYSVILKAIKAPKAEKEALEKYLNQIINQ